ncbi:MAG: MoxR family ATPase [Methylovulum sp.]|nr:MoxR family ATPase [Methylovulum sp.]
MNAANPFIDLKAEKTEILTQCNRFPTAGHYWSQPEIDALIFAFAARRPLLVRGEAGSGKSQIARAAAKHLKADCPLVEVIHPRFEALDLLYRVDVVERLADAQIQKLDETNKRYVKRGRIWQALDNMRGDQHHIPVLLIDEIDKADADLPNALLDVLGNRSFDVPPLNNCTICAPDHRWPLIIITTNEERELPPAFIRRCAVLNLNPPKDDKPFIEWLIQRGRVHQHLAIEDSARQAAAEQVLDDRKTAQSAGYPKVGLAEYIDLLAALHELTQAIKDEEERKQSQLGWLQQLSAYALVKHAEQDQARLPVTPSNPSSPEAD